jgi:hypothetical protein
MRDAMTKDRQRLAALEGMRTPETEELVSRAIGRGVSPESIAVEALEIVRAGSLKALAAPSGTPKNSKTSRLSLLAQALVRKK